jgi:hypothetical protein
MANRDNPRKGSEFEECAYRFFESQGIHLSKKFSIPIGLSSLKKSHKFDLGSGQPPILIECKAHTWTEGDNAPSAKLSVWNEAMFYFVAAPATYRKVLFVLKSVRHGESLAHYYIRRYEHFIPKDVEIWEYEPETNSANVVRFKRSVEN